MAHTPEHTLEESRELERRASSVTGVDPILGDVPFVPGPSESITSEDFMERDVPDFEAFKPIEPPSIKGLDKIRDEQQPDVEPSVQAFEQAVSALDVDKESQVTTRTAAEQRRLNELNKQAQLLEARAFEAEGEARKRGETLGFKGREQAETRRQFAVEALRLNAQIQAAQGNLTLARKLAKDSIDAEFQEQIRDVQTKRRNLLAIYDQLTLEQKRRADETLARLDADDAFLKEQKEKKEAKEEVLLEFAGRVDNTVLERARQAEDAVAAKQILEAAIPAEVDLLSVSEAKALGVPFGTTRQEAFGITPGKDGVVETGTGISPITGKAFTESQSKAGLFASRMQSAETILSVGKEFRSIPFLPQPLKSQQRRQFEQAEKNFITAILRRESGAAISDTEFADARLVYIPQFGDDETTLEQKAEARKIALQGMINESVGSFEQLQGQLPEDLLRQQAENTGVTPSGLKYNIE